eukprot:m.149197 g.149197  ORF g.149197 m.149197 type:complete len:70 (+) comp38518_c0_seq7:77-286(+)
MWCLRHWSLLRDCHIGKSMEPTIKSHDIVAVERISSSFNNCKKGDVVVSRSSQNSKDYVCKRITATVTA